MSVTFWPFCALLEWPPLETESLASEPLSCSSWLSSGPGTFTRIVFCRLLVTVLKTNANFCVTYRNHVSVYLFFDFDFDSFFITWTENWGMYIWLQCSSNNHKIFYVCISMRHCIGKDLHISDFHNRHIQWATHLLSRFSKGVSSGIGPFGGSLLTITLVCGTTLKEKFRKHWLTGTCRYMLHSLTMSDTR